MATANAFPAPPQEFKKVEPNLTTPPPKFDPSIHLAFQPPTTSYTLESLGLSSPRATSPIGITAPFPLLTPAAITALRGSLFKPSILAKHKVADPRYPGTFKLRGVGRSAPFAADIWTHPDVLKACSQAAGIDLEVVYEYEMAHVNVQLGPAMVERGEDCPSAEPPLQTAVPEASLKDVQPLSPAELQVSSWHSDSYPWVCVCMLSDPTGMVGGETAIRTGSGEVIKIRGPQMGWAVMMQGGIINHAALKALGTGERITMVTSFRPKDPDIWDGSHLGNVKWSSDHNELFRQWAGYRADVVGKRAEKFVKRIKENETEWDKEKIREESEKWVEDLINYLKFTVKEMTPEGTKASGY